MPQHHGLGPFRGFIAPTLFIQAALALEIQISPISISLGDTVTISWTTAATDPPFIDFSAACHADEKSLSFPVATNVSGTKSPLTYNMGDLPDGLNSPVTCILKVTDSAAKHLELDESGPITINPKSPPKPPDEILPSKSLAPSIDKPTSISTSPISTPTPPAGRTAKSTNTLETETPSPSASATPTTAEPIVSLRDSTNILTSSSTSPTYLLGPSTSSIPDSAPTFLATNTTSKPRVGAIVGGAVGGIVALLLVVLILLFCRRHRKRLQLSRHLDILRGVKPAASMSARKLMDKEGMFFACVYATIGMLIRTKIG
ncbi:hypothetical protein FPV67DRAFT_295246 [Lyophyllum atratum]|nr:hypothetical protein FPV67DRAFT_295246 [Lyophyllum atratum]